MILASNVVTGVAGHTYAGSAGSPIGSILGGLGFPGTGGTGGTIFAGGTILAVGTVVAGGAGKANSPVTEAVDPRSVPKDGSAEVAHPDDLPSGVRRTRGVGDIVEILHRGHHLCRGAGGRPYSRRG